MSADGEPVTRRECALLHATVGESISGLSRQLVEYHAESTKRFDGVEKRLDGIEKVQGKIEWQITEVAKETKETNGRVKVLERWQQRVIGAAALAFLIITLGAGYLLK
jgi:hypothetical protein